MSDFLPLTQIITLKIPSELALRKFCRILAESLEPGCDGLDSKAESLESRGDGLQIGVVTTQKT